MTVFLVERNFAEQLNVTPDGASSINRVNADIGVQWLISFLSADKKKTYCSTRRPAPTRSARRHRATACRRT